ncbi:hypothetical protein [Snodgrassella alvi]|uniref:hypothetical protein n=1 Tax=Snodgrassella alvi TaxID=1196083 RepID=UPI000CB70314|nr:hypothetical protein [Snodgrassella alvi]PIT14866.1 hypothetical protein BGI33_07190 [Snodgrassella alvi]PIT21090.1 hypothetical protein BGI34_01755 [Snodgrassella alvi]
MAVDVYLVQVAGAVIEVVDGAPIRQGGGDAVAQWVVLVAEGALCGGFAQQVPLLAIAIFLFASFPDIFALLINLTK